MADEGPHQEPTVPYGHVYPSPLDGLIHQAVYVSTDRGARLLRVKCGATMPKYRAHEPLAGVGWPHEVTCGPCQPCPAGATQAAFEAMVAENYANRPAAKKARPS